jgi:hypothetical protein
VIHETPTNSIKHPTKEREKEGTKTENPKS